MKKTILTSWFFTLISAIVLGQVVTISEELNIRNDDEYEVIGKIGKNHLVFQDKETSFWVQSYDENLRMNWDKELELDKRRPKFMGVDRFDVVDSVFYVVYEYRHRGHTKVKLHLYNERADLIDSTLIKDYGVRLVSPNFGIIRSEDRSKLLIYYVDDFSQISADCFDLNTMKLLWETTFEPENYYTGNNETTMLISDKGRMFFTVQKNNYRSKTKVHHYEVYQYDGSTEEVQKQMVPLSEKLTFDINFTYDNRNNQLVGGGIYGDKNTAWGVGSFLLKVPRNSQDTVSITYNPFDDDLVANFLDKDAPRKNRGIFEAVVQEIVMRSDGGILMVIERFKNNQRSYGATTGYYRSDVPLGVLVDLYFENLLVLSIHPDGKPHWEKILRKKQFSQDDNGAFSSYFLLKSPKSLHFIFNDEIRDENTVSEYILTGGGGMERNSVMSTDQQKLKLRFQDGIQISPDEILVPSERRNRLKLVRISF